MIVKLAEFNPEWIANGSAECEQLKKLFGPLATVVEHIGSTCVPGMIAKPVIDIQIGVVGLDVFDKTNGVGILERAGYEYVPRHESTIPFRRFFYRNAETVRINNLHLTADDHPWLVRHRTFRDYLCASDDARDRYASVKRDLAKRDWTDDDDYVGAKSEIVIALEEEAFEHYGFPEKKRTWIRESRIA